MVEHWHIRDFGPSNLLHHENNPANRGIYVKGVSQNIFWENPQNRTFRKKGKK